MKCLRRLLLHGLFLVALSFLCTTDSSAQTPSAPSSPNNPLPQWVTDNARKRDEMDRRHGKDPVPGLRQAEERARSTARLPRDRPGVMNSEDRRRMEELLAPNPADLAAYKTFLEQKGTGIFRMYPNPGCLDKAVVRVDGECANFVLGADTYVFRPGGKSLDISYNGEMLSSFGFFSQYLMADLGDADISGLTPVSPDLKFLTEFVPSTEVSGAREQFRDLARGVESNGKRVSISAVPVVNNTYALRIIAYRLGNDLPLRRGRDWLLRPPMFYLLRSDKRTDMLVVFRVIRKEDDGNLTIVWKELSRKDPPKIKFAKGEKWEDFK